MAAPHVAGAVALLQGLPQFKTATPVQLTTELLAAATTGALQGLDPDSPNKLLDTAPTSGSSVALARKADGMLALVGTNAVGKIFETSQTGANATTWDAWAQGVGSPWYSVGMEATPAGALRLASTTRADDLWLRKSHTRDDWLGWTRLGEKMHATAVAVDQDGRMELFGTNQLGQAFHRRQTAPGSQVWEPFWTQIPFPQRLRQAAAQTRRDGRIELVAVDGAGRVWDSVQSAANTDTWSPWIALGGPGTIEAALAINQDATVELLAIDDAGHAWRTSRPADGSWGSWSALGTATPLRHLAAEAQADGRVVVIGVDNTGAIWQSVQTAANATTYTSWSTIPGQLRN
jgi:hypothetical protein